MTGPYEGNYTMEKYFHIMDILDHLALNEVSEADQAAFFAKLDKLAGDNKELKIEDIAEANDCGHCETWEEIVKALKLLFETGDRI